MRMRLCFCLHNEINSITCTHAHAVDWTKPRCQCAIRFFQTLIKAHGTRTLYVLTGPEEL